MEKQKPGRPTKWRDGTTREDTKTVRIPKRIFSQVLDYAHQLDNDCVTQFQVEIQTLENLKLTVLKSLQVGQQAQIYKRVEKALNREIKKINGDIHGNNK